MAAEQITGTGQGHSAESTLKQVVSELKTDIVNAVEKAVTTVIENHKAEVIAAAQEFFRSIFASKLAKLGIRI